ncbi:MAG: hypothetical protein ACT4OE_09610 [Sphingosinicella sp.]
MTALRTLIAAGLVAGSGPASAQYSTPTPPPSVPQTDRAQPAAQQAQPTSQAEVIRAAACLVGQNAGPGSALLATAPYSAPERQQAAIVLRDAQRCGDARARRPPSALITRGAGAEARYERDFPPAQAAAPPPATVPPAFRTAEATAPNAAAAGPQFALAECAAARRPDLARTYLATDAGTPVESAALREVNRGALAPCVPAELRGRLALDPLGIRAMVAEALYRWSLAQRGSAMPAATPPAPEPARRRRN